jgi:chromosomal replication initiation ATPase DnaA
MKDFFLDFRNARYCFENFIAVEHNLEAKRMAVDFASNEVICQTLVISSTIGNGATHLALSILNKMKENLYLSHDDFAFFTYESLKNEFLIERTIEPQFLNNKKAVCIDSFYDRGRDGVQILNSILTNVQTKIIITCGEEIQVPIPHERIHLSCPSAQDQKIIIEKMFQQDDLLISDEVLKFIANLGINSIRRLEAFINSLHAQSILNHQKINLELTKLTFEKFSSLM